MFNALLKYGAGLTKISFLEDMSLIRLLMFFGCCLMMVGFGVDVDRVVGRFLVEFVGICREVEGDIKDLTSFKLAWIVMLRP